MVRYRQLRSEVILSTCALGLASRLQYGANSGDGPVHCTKRKPSTTSANSIRDNWRYTLEHQPTTNADYRKNRRHTWYGRAKTKNRALRPGYNPFSNYTQAPTKKDQLSSRAEQSMT
ncbi:hypothetical protein Bbelb_174240 [Branchiostoma belcheri]|nr:hypothetical protein Bbelb_174240 [Branchiostoma belcheri]